MYLRAYHVDPQQSKQTSPLVLYPETPHNILQLGFVSGTWTRIFPDLPIGPIGKIPNHLKQNQHNKSLSTWNWYEVVRLGSWCDVAMASGLVALYSPGLADSMWMACHRLFQLIQVANQGKRLLQNHHLYKHWKQLKKL